MRYVGFASDTAQLVSSSSERLLGGLLTAELWRCFGATLGEAAVEELCQLVDPLAAQAVVGQQVRGVLAAEDLLEGYSATSHCLLDPQGVSVDVPQFAESLSGADPERCARIGPYTEW